MSDQKQAVAQKFVTRGNFVAMPLSFPSESEELAPENAFITALAVTKSGKAVIGGTSGEEAHLFDARVKANTGYAFDHGPVPGMTHTVSIAVRKRRFVACCNGPEGGGVFLQRISGWNDGIQEWGFRRFCPIAMASFPGERILDAALLADNDTLLVLTESRLLKVTLPTEPDLPAVPDKNTPPPPPPAGPCPCVAVAGADAAGAAIPRLGVIGDDVYFAAGCGRILRYDSVAGALSPTGAHLPAGTGWQGWAVVPDGRLACADAEGNISLLDPVGGDVIRLGQTLLAPVKCLTFLPDGRGYGLCGDGIGRFFEVDVAERVVRDMGAVATCLAAKRYGFDFSCAVAGRDGEVYFGENDRGGHLWIYYPAQAYYEPEPAGER